METIVATVEASAQQFIQYFYLNYDSQRQNIINLYRETSTVLWNGNAQGAEQYFNFLAQLPQSKHNIDKFDCQPIAATLNPQGACGILVQATGSVKYGDLPETHKFSESFILSPDEKQAGNYYVQSDNFRFV